MKSKSLFSILSTGILLCMAMSVQAQSRIFNSLETNPNVRSAGMGNVMLGNTDQMFLYSNPAALVFANQRIHADVSTEIYPDSEVGRMKQYNFSAGYLTRSCGAFFAGMRYLGGLEIPFSGTNDRTEILKPYEWTADFGYAFRVIPEVVVYASGSYVKSSMGTKADGFTFSVGAGYQKAFAVGGQASLLTVGARMLDLGKPVKYGNTGIPYDTPLSWAVGGDWTVNLGDKHQLTYAVSGRFFTPKDAKETHVGTGVEYVFNQFLMARVGYQYAKQAPERITMGAGVRWKMLQLNVAYQHTREIHGVNTLMVGLGFQL